MSGPEWTAVATGALLDGGLKATALMLAGLGLGTLLRGESAATRHAVYAATLLALPLLPLSALGRGGELAFDQPGLLPLWLLGAVISGAPLLVGRVSLGRAWSRAQPTSHGAQVRVSRDVSTPLTFGWARPRILLPQTCLTWEEDRLAAVLAHERGHIQRRDWLVHAASWSVCALFWFHPGAWLLRRRVMREAEHAADDAALAEGSIPADYAQILVDLARDRPPAAALAHSPSELERRVRAVLTRRRRTGRRRLPLLIVGPLLALSMPALAAWQPWTPPPATPHCQPAE